MGLPIFPTADFDAVIEAYAKGNTVNLPALAYFDFRDGPQAYWGGEYPFSSDLALGGSVTWQGIGKSGVLVAIEGLEDSSNLSSSDMSITVSGVDPAVMTVFKDEDRADYINRLMCIYAQFCDADYQPLCPPYALRAGIMGTMTVDMVQDAQSGSWTRTIKLPASNIFSGRSSAKSSFYTDRDQQKRHPGDKFFQFVSTLQDVTIPVPWHA
jgi:hypothetical protein